MVVLHELNVDAALFLKTRQLSAPKEAALVLNTWGVISTSPFNASS